MRGCRLRRRGSRPRGRFELVALTSVKFFASPLEGTASITDTELTSPLNLAGLSALSLPLPTSGARPAGLQLVVAPCFRRGPAAGQGRARRVGARLSPSRRRSLTLDL